MDTLNDETGYPFEFMRFTIYRDYAVCNICKEQIPKGIRFLSDHWTKCEGAEFTKALHREIAKKRTVTAERLRELQDKYLDNYKEDTDE